MAEFCTCGSLIINGSCTNRNCSNKKSTVKASSKKSKSANRKSSAASGTAKTTRVRRASKCITYNLNDIQPEENIK